ncbi:PAS domain S-box protein [Parapusillimonas granuli]|uniref:Sensor protein FixL n=2 Tax=Parapusillimonas granuli TaxID=380911 RepID=A0A853G3B3_9BURK|nr:PAS domain S-box protein [Parapusillimonas granuli]
MWEIGKMFIDPSLDLPYIDGSHNLGLVTLSVLVAVFCSVMSLLTARIARGSDLTLHRQIAIGTGAIALGGGIWTMHFIGMLSFELCAAVSYDPTVTMLSVLPSLAASWVALQILSRKDVRGWPLVLGGVLVGLGIVTMHYNGMAAMRMTPILRYDPLVFSLSVVLAIALAILALWVHFGLRLARLRPLPRLVLSGTVMGAAISGMHYTGMAAARFIGTPEDALNAVLINNTFVSLWLSTFTITVTVLVTSVNGLIRYRQLYRKMEDSESSIRAIVDTAVDGIITINHHGLIRAFNQSAERLFGWKESEVIGRNIKMLMPEPYQSEHDGYLHNYMSSGKPKIIGSGREVTGLRKDGSLMPMRLAVGQVNLPGAPLFVGFVTDITAQRELESSLREAAERAEQAASAKTAFLANMSHEIRTPMNSIIGFTELLLKDQLTPEQRGYLNIVRKSSHSLLGLLNNILDTIKLEKAAVKVESIDFSLKELAVQIINSLSLNASAKGLLLSFHYPDDMGEYFVGDPLRIQQVLTNLIGNAIKFTEQGAVTVEFSHEAGVVHIAVKDTGIGMSPEQVESIFDPFTQADVSISRRFGGTGLGTTISRQLVKLMQGTIHVDSAPGQGSTFHIRLPLPTGRRPDPVAPNASALALPPLNILIADDVEQNLELLTLILLKSGHDVTSARDGEEVLRKFQQGRYDVALIDIHMPRVDGLTATRRIRELERLQDLPATPIIALTASVMDADRHAARAAGMDGFAVKPLDAVQLTAEIARVLKLAPPEAAAGPESDEDLPDAQIDWAAGVALWGGEQRLMDAATGFLAAVDQRHPLPDGSAPIADWPSVRDSLHGIRGAAGNLSMPGIARHAAALEEALRAGLVDDLAPRIARLKRMLAMASQELRERRAAGPQEPPQADSASAAGLPPAAAAHIEHALAQLERHEIDDASLQPIFASLRAHGAARLHAQLSEALDSFDFDRARTLLREAASVLQARPSDK